jgi:YcaO-like protein with predicted kinase domain
MPVRIASEIFAADKRYLAGTHRTRPPEETFADYSRHMPLLEITRLANVTGLDRIGIPVWMAVRPNSRSLSVSQGKGLDHTSAKVSALMESVETWHAEHLVSPIVFDSYLALRRQYTVVDPAQLPRKASVALRLDLPMNWVEGYDLLQEKSTWVPHQCLSLNTIPDLVEPDMFVRSTNGLASGNHMLEAVVHGLCEVIERDAGALFWGCSEDERTSRRIDLSSINDPLCRSVIERLRSADVHVVVHDIASDIELPAYECTIFDSPDETRWSLKGFRRGAGAHLAPQVALLRALTEAVQSRLTMIAGSRDDLFWSAYEGDDPAALRAELRAEPPSRAFRTMSLATATFEGDCTTLLSMLRRVGVTSVVCVPLTRPELGVPVVKIIVPGLEGTVEADEYLPGARALARHSRGSPASN